LREKIIAIQQFAAADRVRRWYAWRVLRAIILVIGASLTGIWGGL